MAKRPGAPRKPEHELSSRQKSRRLNKDIEEFDLAGDELLLLDRKVAQDFPAPNPPSLSPVSPSQSMSSTGGLQDGTLDPVCFDEVHCDDKPPCSMPSVNSNDSMSQLESDNFSSNDEVDFSSYSDNDADESFTSGLDWSDNNDSFNSIFSLDSMDEEDEDDQGADPVAHLRKDLCDWSVSENIPRTSLTKLLKVLKRHPALGELPSDSRTLLKTPRCVNTKEMKPGSYYHFGLVDGLSRSLSSLGLIELPSEILVQINMDGLPLADSSNSQFWPILGLIRNVEKEVVFLIGIYQGNKKPTDSNDLILDYYNEAKIVERDGILFEGHTISVSFFYSFDAPAKSYILQVKGHCGFEGCCKCCTKGLHVKV